MHQTTLRLFKPTLAAIALAMLAARGGDDDAPVVAAPEPEPTRLEDTRGYEPVVEATFAALAGSAVDADRWTSVLGGAAYRVEVPTTGWTGQPVHLTHWTDCLQANYPACPVNGVPR